MRPLIPTIEQYQNYQNTFGGQIRSRRHEANLDREQLAGNVVQLAIGEEAALLAQMADRKEQIKEKIALLEEKLRTFSELKQVTGDTVADWEANTPVPSKQAVEMLAEIFSLAPDKKAAFIELANDTRKKFARADRPRIERSETFGALLNKTRRASVFRLEDDIAAEMQLRTESELSDISGRVTTEAALEKQLGDLRKELEKEQEFKRPVFVILDGNGKEISLSDGEGHTLKITGEHINMIETGMYPSPSFTKGLLDVLEHAGAIDKAKRREMEERYSELADALPRHVDLKKYDIPLHALSEFLDSAPVVVENKPVVVDTVPAPVLDAVPAAPPVPDAAADKPAETPAIKVVEPENPEILPFIPYQPQPERRNSKIIELAKSYEAIFSAFGLEAPSDTMAATSSKVNSDGARAQLAGKIGLKLDAIPELRPFSLTELPEKELAAKLITRASNPMEMKRMIENYNRLVGEVREDISNSAQGQRLGQEQKRLESYLSHNEPRQHHFRTMIAFNSQTQVPQKSFDDYYLKGGLQMPGAKDIHAVLGIVNQQWFNAGDRKHNVLKLNAQTWRPEVDDYMDAHQNVRSLYENRRREFEAAIGELLEQRQHNLVRKQWAEELILLRSREEMAIDRPTDRDLQLRSNEMARLKELEKLERTDQGFADIVLTAVEDDKWRNQDAMRRRKTTERTPS